MNAPALRGLRILVTRARSQASRLSDLLRAQGTEPVELPAIEIEPLEDFSALDEALARLRDFDWVVLTSVNGVRAIADRLRTQGRGARELEVCRIAAIGPATAQALREQGCRVDFVPARFLSEQIAADLPIQERGPAASVRVLLLRADIAPERLAELLRLRGAHVTSIAAYRTRLPASIATPLDAANLLAEIDAITFTSASTVRNLCALLPSFSPSSLAGKRGLGGVRSPRPLFFCIGPVTAAAARELGLEVAAVAEEHTLEGLVRTIVEYYASTPKREETGWSNRVSNRPK